MWSLTQTKNWLRWAIFSGDIFFTLTLAWWELASAACNSLSSTKFTLRLQTWETIGLTSISIWSSTGIHKKHEAKIKKDIKQGIREANKHNPFEIFIMVTDIRYTYVLVSSQVSWPLLSTAIIRNPKRFSGIHLGCWSCKTSRWSCWTFLPIQSRLWKVVGLLCSYWRL